MNFTDNSKVLFMRMCKICLLMIGVCMGTVAYAEEIEQPVDSMEEVAPVERTYVDFVPKHNVNLPVSPAALNVENYYKPLDDLSFAGVPLFVAGIIAKAEKKSFRQDYSDSHANTRLVTNFKTEIDNYTQFFAPALALGLKIGGVEGRSDWMRFAASAAMTYGIMATFVNGIKYTSKEMRPDGSTANSWPSGHTATAFAGATILHKEYGLTVSPWYSVVAYGSATATGIMRILNNRHWVSDVLSGAGIGIMSGELAYMFSDLIFKGKGLLRTDISNYSKLDRQHPSFFDVSMGMGFGSKDLTFDDFILTHDNGSPINISFSNATVMGVEGAYFLNKYVGVGGRLRVRSSPMKGWDRIMAAAKTEADEFVTSLKESDKDGDPIDVEMADFIKDVEFTIVSDHITEFTGDVGMYFNLPLSDRMALGAKALIGRSVVQDLDINAQIEGKVKDVKYDLVIRDGEFDDESFNINNVLSTGDDYSYSWDYLTLGGNNSTKYGLGLSFTYAYKNNFCWKLFCDYDYTKKTYTLTYDPDSYMSVAMPKILELYRILDYEIEPMVFTKNKTMNQFVIGASFSVSF